MFATVTLPDLGIAISEYGTAFGTAAGTAIAVGLGVMFAVTLVVIGARWLMAGGKKR